MKPSRKKSNKGCAIGLIGSPDQPVEQKCHADCGPDETIAKKIHLREQDEISDHKKVGNCKSDETQPAPEQ